MAAAGSFLGVGVDALHPATQRALLHAVDEALEVVAFVQREGPAVVPLVRFARVDERDDRPVGKAERNLMRLAVDILDWDLEGEAELTVGMAQRRLNVFAQAVARDEADFLAVDQNMQHRRLAGTARIDCPALRHQAVEGVEVAEERALDRRTHAGANCRRRRRQCVLRSVLFYGDHGIQRDYSCPAVTSFMTANDLSRDR